MKSLVIILYFLLISQFCFASFQNNELKIKHSNNEKSKKNYVFGDVHAFSVINTASGKYFPDMGQKLTNSAGGIGGRWDWVMPQYGGYAYVDGVALLGSFNNYYPSGGFLEGGYGWMFKKSNKKARESSDFIRYQLGFGVCFGIRAMGFDQSHTTSYGGIWPEVASIVNVGENLTIHPKYSFFPMLNNGLWGSRSSAELLVSYRLLGWLGASARLQSETLFFNDEVAAWNGGQYTGKAKFKTLQVGLSFHLTN